ncbi:Flap endonuclease 1 [Frankliniella fusca]|uniref:Flap endonuclease 1 n=1 Tax=Frankliniella fusca TaxID=407009 RepID=A0AAE1HWH6_9NEOP|nr:Flap endonuclease 1 [Frankliniella fusca]
MKTAVPAVLAALCALAAQGAELNTLLTKYSLIPDPFGLKAFFHMPRTLEAAAKDKWAEVSSNLSAKGVSVWCRDNDYRVCLLFDSVGSVAGIQVSHSVSDLKKTKVPQDFSTIPDWTRQTVLGVDVFSAIAYFVDPSKLAEGLGRPMDDDTNTAEGIWIEQANASPARIAFEEEELAATTNYTKQGCLFGQGQHYFYNITKDSGCEERRPYYMLYDAKTKQMLGFGVIIFGKTSQAGCLHRNWFLNPPSFVAPFVTPNGPSCTQEWMHKYGATSLHVFFRPNPWNISCRT